MRIGTPERPFSLVPEFKLPFANRIATPLFGLAERLLGLAEFNRMYEEAARTCPHLEAADRALAMFNVRVEVEGSPDAIPATGPVVIVANHPLGMLDGIALVSMLKKARPDARVMANRVLACWPELARDLVLVDPFGGPQARAANLRGMREALAHLAEGNALGVFPAGEVASYRLAQGRVTDAPWSPSVARLVRSCEASVVPVFFEGCNSALFQVLGLVHPLLRTVRLPRELLRKRGCVLRARIGAPVPFSELSGLTSDRALVGALRVRTFLLREPVSGAAAQAAAPQAGTRTAHPTPSEDVAGDIAELPPESLLTTSGDYEVRVARAWQIPRALREIGRLREVTFRLAREGTGRDLDIDRFDADYLHLFVWQREKREIVGAYRLGPTDEIVARRGVKGLYTSTLFRFSRRLVEQISPALELGRSWVRPEYQRAFAPLMLLWKGIGQYVVRNPRYKTLFGPVSINADYADASKDFLVRFLKANNYWPELASMVRARNPLRLRPGSDWDPQETSLAASDIEDVSRLIATIERDHKGVPVLLRQYLKLGARLVGFNVDPDFGSVLDGLIVADLTRADTRTLDRYLGPEGARSFLASHGLARDDATHAESSARLRTIAAR